MTYRVKFIRPTPFDAYRAGDELEDALAWWFVDLGYAVPINFERAFDAAKAARARKKLESWYATVVAEKRARRKATSA